MARGGKMDKGFLERIREAEGSLESLRFLAGEIFDKSGTGEDSREAENCLVEAVLKKTSSPEEVVDFSQSFGTFTGCHRLITAYVKQCGIGNAAHFPLLMKMIFTSNLGGKEAYAAILDALKNFLDRGADLDKLCFLARHCGKEIFADGNEMEPAENLLVDAALESIFSEKDAGLLASAFSSKRGTHNFIRRFAGMKGFATLEGARRLYDEICGDNFFGKEAKEAVIEAASRAGFKTDCFFSGNERILPAREKGIAGEAEKLARAVAGAVLSRLSIGEKLREARNPEDSSCNCIDCQLERLCAESPENEHLREEYREFEGWMIKQGLWEKSFGSSLRSKLNGEEVDRLAAEWGVSEKLREIIKIAQKKPEERPSSPFEIGKILQGAGREMVGSEGKLMIDADPLRLEADLRRAKEEGRLEYMRIQLTPGLVFSLEEFVRSPFFEKIGPELQAVFQKYSSSIVYH